MNECVFLGIIMHLLIVGFVLFEALCVLPFRYIHPAGFPAEHTIGMGFRLLQSTPREPFALWQLTDSDFQPKMGVMLDRE